jgi:hypothetical protein
MQCDCMPAAGTSGSRDRCICGAVGAPLLPLLVQSVGVQHLQVASPGRLQELSAHAGGGGNWHATTSEGTPSRMPPPLRRQNASRFSWPPDRQQEWVYIRLSPSEFVEQAAFSLDLQLTVRQVQSYTAGTPGSQPPRSFAATRHYAAEYTRQRYNATHYTPYATPLLAPLGRSASSSSPRSRTAPRTPGTLPGGERR